MKPANPIIAFLALPLLSLAASSRETPGFLIKTRIKPVSRMNRPPPPHLDDLCLDGMHASPADDIKQLRKVVFFSNPIHAAYGHLNDTRLEFNWPCET